MGWRPQQCARSSHDQRHRYPSRTKCGFSGCRGAAFSSPCPLYSTFCALCCCFCTLVASLCLLLCSICAHIAPLCRVLLLELEQDKSNGSIGKTSALLTNWEKIGLQQCRSSGSSKVLLLSSKRRPVPHNCTYLISGMSQSISTLWLFD